MSTLSEAEICGCDFSQVTELENLVDQIEHELKKVVRKNCNCDIEDLMKRISALKGEKSPSKPVDDGICPCSAPECTRHPPQPVAQSTPKTDEDILKEKESEPKDSAPTVENITERDNVIALIKDRDTSDPEIKRLYIQEAISLKDRLDILLKIVEQAVKYIFVTFEPLDAQLKWFNERRAQGKIDRWDDVDLTHLITDAKVTGEDKLLPILGKWMMEMQQKEPAKPIIDLHKKLRSDQADSIPQQIIDGEIMRIKQQEKAIESTIYEYVVWMESLPDLFMNLQRWMQYYVRENPKHHHLSIRVSDFLMFAEDIRDRLLDYISCRKFEETLGLDEFID